MSERIRLHKAIAQSGLCSRRKAEELIAQGRVEVNGQFVTEMGVTVTENDEIRVDGDRISAREHIYLLLNKPKGYVTTTADEMGRQTVLDLIPERYRHLKPVGRLDKDTEGLLILTNDGTLAAHLTHARYGVEKEYIAVVEGLANEDQISSLRKGVFIEGIRHRMAQVTVGKLDTKHMTTTLNILLHEGRKRQIRVMTQTVGLPIRSLRRVRIGNLIVKGMAPGECRIIPQKDLERLRSIAKLKG